MSFLRHNEDAPQVDFEKFHEKTLSAGLRVLVPKGPSAPLPYDAKIDIISRQAQEFEERQKQQRLQREVDRKPLPVDRRPYVRQDHNEYYQTGFVIGDQRDQTKLHGDKLKVQLAYKEQLMADKAIRDSKHQEAEEGRDRPVNRDRLLKRITDLQEEQLYTGVGGFMIGQDPALVREERKMKALQLHALAIKDVPGNTLNSKTLREKLAERSAVETDGYSFNIGADEAKVKKEKRAQAREFYNQMSAEIDNSAKGQERSRRGVPGEGNKWVEATGWTGLQIGRDTYDGTEAQKRQTLALKHQAQANYRSALDLQKQAATRIAKEREDMYEPDLSSTKLPYMRY